VVVSPTARWAETIGWRRAGCRDGR
jgi:hypothetical protein